MNFGKVVSRIRAGVLALALALPHGGPLPVTTTVGAGAAVVLSVAADEAEARSRTGSRSGSSSYSRSSSSRTPSYSPSRSSSSSGDRAVSRRNSATALDAYRARQQPTAPAAPATSRTSVPDSGGANRTTGRNESSSSSWNWSSGSSGTSRRPSADVYAPYRRYDPRWTPPAYAMQGPRRFGAWDAAMLWFLFDTLSRPGHAAFFHDNAADPGVTQWRSEAERLAAADPAVQTRLAALDQRLAAQAAAPPQPGRVPDSVVDKLIPAADFNAAGDDADAEGDLVDLIVGLAVLALIAAFFIVALIFVSRIWRRIFGRRSPGPDSAGEQAVFNPFNGGDKEKRRSPFRVGMTVTIDPTPFLLAGGAIKVKQPPASAAGMTNAQGIGVLNSAALALHRIYLSDGDFVQIHLDDEGRPDECRLFHVIDEIDPADEEAWGQWLDKRKGLIGLGDFETPDGRIYERAWSPGRSRIAPVKFHETEESAKGLTLSTYECMLYRADTGLAPPAPEVEYLLVSVVERDDQAWVEIAAGVDINPASLSLT